MIKVSTFSPVKDMFPCHTPIVQEIILETTYY